MRSYLTDPVTWLIAAFIVGGLIAFSGCATRRLMRCPMPAAEGTFYCPHQIEGEYRMCEAPREVYRCQELP